jgi:hypothetical protein
MGREAHANAEARPAIEMRLLQLESVLTQIDEQARLVTVVNSGLIARVTALEAQTAAMIALHHDEARRLQTAIGLVQTVVYGSRLARWRWLLGI